MYNFLWPYFILLLPLPVIYLLVYKILKKSKYNLNNINTNGLRIPFYDELLANINRNNPEVLQQSSKKQHYYNLFKCLLWTSFILALMRPIALDKPLPIPIPAHDIMMAIDISGSMSADDMSDDYQLTRLEVVKQIGHQFIEQREIDRMGLVFFGSSAFVSSPLTLDKSSLHNFLEKTQIGFAGGRTAIGDAIGLAIKRLKTGDNNNNKKFIILLSDGSNTSGDVDPIKAAQIAADNNIKIYTIGIGRLSNNPIDIVSGMSLDEETLKQIAQLTDAQYFHASSKHALAQIYNKISKLQPSSEDSKIVRPQKELFVYPLLVTFMSSIFLLI